MAIIRDFRDGLPASGISPATLYVYLRALVVAGLIRKSRQGSRRLLAHLDATEAATILLSLAALYPTDAVKAAEGLADLRRENLPSSAVGLRDTLAVMIQNRAALLAVAPDAPPPDTGSWELHLCTDPPSAWMSWNDGETRERFRHPQTEIPIVRQADSHERGLRRETVITWALVEQAARLVADTLHRTGKAPTIEPTPTAETENAAPARTALREDPPEAQATDRSSLSSSDSTSCARAPATLSHERRTGPCVETITSA